MFVYGDVVYAQTWQVLTLKNCMEPFSYASAASVAASALVSVRLFCKNLGNLQKFFEQMVYRPPWQKIARTPMGGVVRSKRERKKTVTALPSPLTPSPIVSPFDHSSAFTRLNLSLYELQMN